MIPIIPQLLTEERKTYVKEHCICYQTKLATKKKKIQNFFAVEGLLKSYKYIKNNQFQPFFTLLIASNIAIEFERP